MTISPFARLADTAQRRSDGRGYLDVLYESGEVVLKRSWSRAGVFRGMHWQKLPHAQTKLIRVASGRILDFVLDPLSEKPTLYSRALSPADGWIRIEAHLAHGFYAFEDTEFEYLCHGAYNEAAESGYSIVHCLREHYGFSNLILSEKDLAAPAIQVVIA